jgi:hypothetical protein
MVPEKVGLKGVQRNDLDFEFTIVLDIDIKHNALASKDRTSLFMDKPEFVITEDTGKIINDWCNQGDNITMGVMDNLTNNVISEEELLIRISSCKSVDELLTLYNDQPVYQETHLVHFTKRRAELSGRIPINKINNNLKSLTNGSITNK